jgi:hypothetical protein
VVGSGSGTKSLVRTNTSVLEIYRNAPNSNSLGLGRFPASCEYLEDWDLQ